MCGFTGFLSNHVLDNNTAIKLLSKMGQAIATRGPDSADVWHDGLSGIGLSHRRLAIVDLSPAGAQPMHSSTGRYVIAFNGEIYNHQLLRAQLNHVTWRGHSDTETLLEGFEHWGIQTTIEQCIGMFAFAVWDIQNNILTLGRDRFGEKPLYYGWQGTGKQRSFLFGSELKALKVHPALNPVIDRGALALFLRHNYIPAPYSIYKEIYKLEPGCLLTVSRENIHPKIIRYWSASDVAAKAISERQKKNTQNKSETINELDTLLKDSVKQQMMADVPLGAFLSGGIDSSTIVALMQAQSSKPVKTFTIGFNEEGYNEALHAKTVANHLGTEHTEFYVTPQQAMDVIPKLPHLYCEPFADSSQIPTYLVSQLAKQSVTVSLSGDAGDELFSGYNRYQLTNSLWNKLSKMPVSLRRVAAKSITAVSPNTWTAIGRSIPIINKHSAVAMLGDKLHKAAGILSSNNVDDLYIGLVSHNNNPTTWIKGLSNSPVIEPPTILTNNQLNILQLNSVEKMMLLDTMSYLPDDILCKVDRAGMGVSLESRIPFLDHRIFEFAWNLPIEYKLCEGQTKWILRQVLYKYVPKELIDRPKMGFGIPLHDWLRGPLKDWVETLINEEKLNREGYFYSEPIQSMWKAHLSGSRNFAHQLWPILMFQAWLEAQ